MKYQELSALSQTLTELSDLPMPMRLALKIRRITRALKQHLDDIASEERKIIKWYAKLDEKGNPILENNQFTFNTDSDMISFSEQRQELWNQEWEPPEKINVSDFGDIEIKPKILIGLGDVLADSDVTSSNAPNS